MKSKIFKPITILVLLALTIYSCELSDFDNMNVDQKAPSKPVTSYMLTNCLENVPRVILYEGSSDFQTGYFVQYFSRVEYSEFYNFWSQGFPFYQNVLINLKSIIDQNSDEITKTEVSAFGDNNNQIAVARILRVYFYLSMTDRWGAIPYSEALQGQANLRPKFDNQEDIYNDLFKELKEAVDLMDPNSINPLKGDFIFMGNMQRWQQFANTTRLIMALRIADVNPAKGKEEFLAAMNSAGGIIESIDQAISYPFMEDEKDANNNYFYYAYNGTTPSIAPSKGIIDYLKSLSDPRLSVYAEPASLTGEFIGKALEANQTDKNSISLLGSSFRQKNTPLAIYSYSQVLFTLSEATVRGWIAGSDAQAEQYYNEAIKASFQENGIFSNSTLTTYLNNPDVKFNAAEAYKNIGYQKWLALFPRGNEAWIEWRRLDYPVFTPVPGALTDDQKIPLRYSYSTDLVNLMPEEYQAINAIQPDKSYTRVWWDVK
jgi:hypothetical protein